MLVIKGKNGSGKTTLIRILAGVIEPDIGEVEVNGSLVYVSHKNSFKDDLSVYQNLLFWVEYYGNDEILDCTIHLFSLNRILGRKFGELSKGWQRRVALSRIIISNADIWILDEPHSNLDNESTNILKSLIEAKLEQKGIVILSTHDNFKIEHINTKTLYI